MRKELVDVRAQVRALHEANRRAEQRLGRLEQELMVARARTGGPTGSSSAVPAQEAIPELTVIKLRPRQEPAPALSTAVAVVEPERGEVAALLESPMEAPPAVDVGGESVDPSLLDLELDSAVSALRTGNVAGGVERLKRFAADNPRHARADNALYYAGLGLMGLEDYKGAVAALELLVSTYPAGDAVTEALLRLAECRLKLHQVSDARAIYTRLLAAFPGTQAATQAEQRLSALSHPP